MIINNNYNSIVYKDDFIILEDEINLERRIIKFFDYLNVVHKNDTVLLVSHMGVINKIKDLYIKKTGMDDEFKMGSFEIYDL
jgi:broad specificity phosphatase PhoE